MNSGFDYFGLDGSGAGFDSVFGGGGVSLRVSGGGGQVSLGFSTAWLPAFYGSSGAFSSWGLAAVSVDHS